jgi:predicted transposase YdaD
VYLNELGETSQLPIDVALVLLTTTTQQQAPIAARELLARTQQEEIAEERRRAIIEIVIKIISYQFTYLNRVEIEAMLEIQIQETQLYQDIKEEGREKATLNLILRQLNRQLSQEISDELFAQISGLSLLQLERLGEALLNFRAIADLETWLTEN